MKRYWHAFIYAMCIICCVALFAGCTDNGGAASQTTPAPTGSAGAQQTPSDEDGFLRPRDPNLKNAIKAGETYRYFIVSTTDPSNPFEGQSDDERDFWLARKSSYEKKYGIKIEYVLSDPNWLNTFPEAAYSGAPQADIFHMGGPWTVYFVYNYQNVPGSVIDSLSKYSEYADFSDPEWFDQSSQKVVTFDQQLYCAVPNDTGINSIALNQVLLFNKEILLQNGYKDTEIYDMYNSGNWTWEAFREVAVRCTDPDNDVYGIHMGENNALMWNLMAGNNAHILSETSDSSGKTYYQFSGDSANALEAWTFFLSLNDSNALLAEETEDRVTFRAGKIAMMTTYVNRAMDITNYRQYPQFGIVMVPKGPKADDYVSSRNYFTPICIFKGIANPAGAAQVLSEYLAPQYAQSSEEAQAQFEAGALKISCDDQSVEVLKQINGKSVTEPYMMYWTSPNFMAGDTQETIRGIYVNYVHALLDGSQTPAVLFDSVKGPLDEMLKSAQGIE